MPLATFLVAFSKQFGESALLGEEFMKLLTHYDFKVSGNLLPCFRVAVLAAQLTSSKIVDKISKLLVKRDFDRLKTKCKAELQDAEKLLADSWSLVEKAKHLEELKRLHVFVRIGKSGAVHLQETKNGQGEQDLEIFGRHQRPICF